MYSRTDCVTYIMCIPWANALHFYSKHTVNGMVNVLLFEWNFNSLILCFIYRRWKNTCKIFERAVEEQLVKRKSTSDTLIACKKPEGNIAENWRGNPLVKISANISNFLYGPFHQVVPISLKVSAHFNRKQFQEF